MNDGLRFDIAIFILLLCFPIYVLAENKALFIGGNCDEGKEQNSFVYGFNRVAAGLKKSGWSVDVLFDGDNTSDFSPEETTLILAPECSGPKPSKRCPYKINPAKWSKRSIAESAALKPSEIRTASKENLLKKLDTQIQQLQPNSQFLLVIYTHGSPTFDNGPQTVCLSDGEMRIDDPEFLKKLEKLKEKKIKLGFINDSCFSGGSVHVLEKYGCSLAPTTGDRTSSQYALGLTFADLLKDPPKFESRITKHGLANLKTITMETIFLNYFVRAGQFDEPQMSGFSTGSDVAQILADFTTFSDPRTDQKFLPDNYCSSQKIHDAFLNLEKLSKQIHVPSPDEELIHKLWLDYSGGGEGDRFSDFSNFQTGYSQNQQLIQEDLNKFAEMARKESELWNQLFSTFSKKNRNDYQYVYNVIHKKIPLETETQKRLLSDLLALRDQIWRESLKIEKTTQKLRNEAAQIRFALYILNKKAGKSNSCSDFILKTM